MNNWKSKMGSIANQATTAAASAATSAHTAVKGVMNDQIGKIIKIVTAVEKEVPPLSEQESQDSVKVEQRNKQIQELVTQRLNQQLNTASDQAKTAIKTAISTGVDAASNAANSAVASAAATATAITAGLLSKFDEKIDNLKMQADTIFKDAEKNAKEKAGKGQPVDQKQILNEVANIMKQKITALVDGFKADALATASSARQGLPSNANEDLTGGKRRRKTIYKGGARKTRRNYSSRKYKKRRVKKSKKVKKVKRTKKQFKLF
jgi:hypothetical protein